MEQSSLKKRGRGTLTAALHDHRSLAAVLSAVLIKRIIIYVVNVGHLYRLDFSEGLMQCSAPVREPETLWGLKEGSCLHGFASESSSQLLKRPGPHAGRPAVKNRHAQHPFSSHDTCSHTIL